MMVQEKSTATMIKETGSICTINWYVNLGLRVGVQTIFARTQKLVTEKKFKKRRSRRRRVYMLDDNGHPTASYARVL